MLELLINVICYWKILFSKNIFITPLVHLMEFYKIHKEMSEFSSVSVVTTDVDFWEFIFKEIFPKFIYSQEFMGS